jgi:hypothetical protein
MSGPSEFVMENPHASFQVAASTNADAFELELDFTVVSQMYWTANPTCVLLEQRIHPRRMAIYLEPYTNNNLAFPLPQI